MIEVYVDGLCEGLNPGGVACYGIHVPKLGIRLYGVIGTGQQMSNNVAEFGAVIRALELLRGKHLEEEQIVIYSDSQLLVNVLSGRWQPRSGLYLPYCHSAIQLLRQFRDVTFRWIPREDNTVADALSRKAYEWWCKQHGRKPVYELYKRMRKPTSTETCLSCRWVGYSGPHIGCYYKGKWRKWLPKKFARTSKCPNFEAK